MTSLEKSETISATTHLPHPKYRTDINGLRAIAVVAVVLYHFGIPGFSGGFVGVDVFFVISGFLMTGIIIRGLERGSFSLWDFYLARARRIVPALLVLCASLLLLGWFSLPSLDYKALAIHVATAMAFVSNIQFWKEAGYFDVASHEKWLLHTWSLSVEWQFYILLPLGSLLVWRLLGPRALRWTLMALGVGSLLLSVYASQRWPTPAFYLLPTRIWEMLAGGLAWWLTRKHLLNTNLGTLMERVGLLLIGLAIVLYDTGLAWPGHAALVPVVGTMLVLAANRQRSWFTNNFIARHLGASSYSIYLWHWPLVVILNYLGESNNPILIASCIALSILLGELSYRLIENPSRVKLASLKKYKEPAITIIPASLIIISACFVYISNGINTNWRHGASTEISKYIDKYSKENYLTDSVKTEYREECNFFDSEQFVAKKESIAASCTLWQEGKSVFLWGDSHAQALSYGIRQHLKNDIIFYQVASSACQPNLGKDTATQGEFKLACDRSNDFALHEIYRLKPDLVIIAQQHNHDKNDYAGIVGQLSSIGIKNIVLIGPVPQWQPSLPRSIALRHFSAQEKTINDNSFDSTLLDTDKNMKTAFGAGSNATYISLLDHLCKGTECLAKVDNHNAPLVWDYGHLSLPGSDFIVKEILSKQDVLSDYLQ